MPLRSLLPSLLCLLIVSAAWGVYAEPLPGSYIQPPSTSTPLKPVAVIYFTDNMAQHDYANSLKTMILESKREFGLAIGEYALDNESDLAAAIDKIADGETGMIIIIQPRDINALMRIPGLYPDIRFSIIDVMEPLYLINVNSILFKEQEGTFISGTLAALQSTTGVIRFVAKEDTPITRNLAYAYFQGAKYVNPEIQVIQQLGGQHIQNSKHMPVSMQHKMVHTPNADVAFILDNELMESALKNAREQKQLLITSTPDAMKNYSAAILTSLLKHYDLALYNAVKNYATHNWVPVTQQLGLGNGYIDYIVDSRNRALFSKDNIERTERTKDLVAQGLLKITTLSQ